MNLTYTDKFNGEIHFEYIPLKSRQNYIPLELSDDSVRINDRDLEIISVNRFAPEELKAIQKRIRGFYPASSEKGIQASFVLNNPQFLDSEFQYENKIRFDLIWLDITKRKLFVVELKTIGDQRLYIGSSGAKRKNSEKIDRQLSKYRDFVVENKNELLGHYQNLFMVKKKLGILSPSLNSLDSLNGYTFEERPILLIGDCTQDWINKQKDDLNEAIQDIAYGCFYQGGATRRFSIPDGSRRNRFIFP